MSGRVSAPEPPGFEGYFGPGPHFRFLEDQGLALRAMTERIREFPDRATPEDTLRALMNSRGAAIQHNIDSVLKFLYQKMDEEGDVEGIIGYSEGALVAATVLLEDERQAVEDGQPRRLKAGVFFAGWPPVDARTGDVLLADERDDLRIRVPTLHVIGSEDPYLAGSKALYNLCDEDTAVLFDHAKGHTLPQDARTIGELGVATREMMGVACT